MSYAPIPETLVIGFAYRAQHGKDTAARTIVQHSKGAKVYAMSNAISVYCRVAYRMTKRSAPLLQDVGYRLRSERPSIWTDALYWLIDEERPPVALISGVRFPDEAQMVADMGGVLVCIDRITEEGQPYIARDRDPNHSTEHALDDHVFQYRITNISGQIEAFRREVTCVYYAILATRGLEVPP